MVPRDMEKRAAKRCQAWNSGETHRCCSPSTPHWRMDAIFSPVAASHSRSWCKRCPALASPSGLSHCFLARVDMIVLFFLEDNKQGIPLMTEHQLSLFPFYAGWGIYNQRLVAGS